MVCFLQAKSNGPIFHIKGMCYMYGTEEIHQAYKLSWQVSRLYANSSWTEPSSEVHQSFGLKTLKCQGSIPNPPFKHNNKNQSVQHQTVH